MPDYTFLQAYNWGTTNEGAAFTVTNQLAAVLATGTAGTDGTGTISLTVPDDSTSTLTFTRDSDARVLGVTVFDPRDIPALNVIASPTDYATAAQVDEVGDLVAALDFTTAAEQIDTIYDQIQSVAPSPEPIIVLPATPENVGMSALFLDVIDDGAPLDGVSVVARIVETQPIVVGTSYEAANRTELRTGHAGIAGRVQFSTYPGRKYRITSGALGLDKTVTAPDAGTGADVYSLPETP